MRTPAVDKTTKPFISATCAMAFRSFVFQILCNMQQKIDQYILLYSRELCAAGHQNAQALILGAQLQ